MAITISKDQLTGIPNHLPGHLVTCAQPVPISQTVPCRFFLLTKGSVSPLYGD